MNSVDLKAFLYNEIRTKVQSLDSVNSGSFIRVETEIECVDFIYWLKLQKFNNKFYWKDREGNLEIASVGTVDLIIPDLKDNSPLIMISKKLAEGPEGLRYYGAIGFDNNSKTISESNFGKTHFFVPRFELNRYNSKVMLKCNFCLPELIELETSFNILKQDLDDLNLDSELYKDEKLDGTIVYENVVPDRFKWNEMFSRLTKEISNGELDKVVLAGKREIVFEEDLNVFNLFSKIRDYNPCAIIFFLQTDTSSYFLGATPEYLYERKHRDLKSQAIAGTRKRGVNIEEDKILENELLNSQKEFKEHLYVREYFENAFKKLCCSFKCDRELTVKKFSSLQHLYCELSGKLKEGVTDADIIEKLHPSPAVGGVKKEKALDFIRQNEPFERGFYGAPIGWISKNSAKFSVAIRSGLIQYLSPDEFSDQLDLNPDFNLDLNGKYCFLTLFAGAGIVNGSSVDKEWTEIEDKMENFMKVFQLKENNDNE